MIGSTKVRSVPRGRSTSDVEVTNISKHGFWVLVEGREHFLAFSNFPWFRDASVANILNVQLPHPARLYWPALDIDLALESIDYPPRFPLVSRARPAASSKRRPAKSTLRSVKRSRRGRR